MKVQDIAQALGNNFFSIEEVSDNLKISYSSEQRQRLTSFSLVADEIEELLSEKFFLLPGPPTPTSYDDMKKVSDKLAEEQGQWFGEIHNNYGHPWKYNRQTRHLVNEMVENAWLAPRKKLVSGSTHLEWGDQLDTVAKVEFVPRVTELLWAMFVCQVCRGSSPLYQKSARTSSTLQKDGYWAKFGGCRQIILNHYDRLCVEWPHKEAKNNLGIISMLKLS